jgi:hypothetical protein
VYRFGKEGYIVAASAGRDERIRVEPFEAIELSVALPFGADES